MSEYSSKSTGSCDPSKSSSGNNKPENMNPSMKGGKELSIEFSVTYSKLAEFLQLANVPYLMPDLAYKHCPASVVVTFPVLYGDANGNENAEGSDTISTPGSSQGLNIVGSENSEGSVGTGTPSSLNGSNYSGSEEEGGEVMVQVWSPFESLCGISGAGRPWGGVEFIVDRGSPLYIVDTAETEEEGAAAETEEEGAAAETEEEGAAAETEEEGAAAETEEETEVPNEGEMDWASFSGVEQPSVIEDVSVPGVDWQEHSFESVTSPYIGGVDDEDAHEAQPGRRGRYRRRRA